jgi:NAD(P)-dependent dehydrogenase (short-subunit alcohol dehydrogenase family)
VDQFDGKIALVTAGGAGIGQATVRLLAERGAQVIATDIDEAGLKETLTGAAVPERIRTIHADATTEEGATAAVRAAVDIFGGLHILANVVGGSRPGKTVVDMPPDEWDMWVRLNLTSTYLMCRAAIPEIAKCGGGSIVNVSSGAGLSGMMKNPAYVAAKGGVIALTRSLALDHAEQGIRANCIAPGAILTTLMHRNRTPDEIKYLGSRTLVGRIGDPHDIAATIAFLCSKDGEFMNGETLNVSGGAKAGI